MELSEQPNISAHLQVFMGFVCEEKVHSIEELMNSSIVLLKYCPASRQAIFQFYGQLFTEYCYEYCLANGNNTIGNFDKKESIFLQRFIRALNTSNVEKITKQNDEVSEKPEIRSPTEDGPQSPSREIAEISDYDMEDLSLGGKENELSLIISLMDRHMSKLADTLTSLQEKDVDTSFTTSISDWALNLASEMSQAFSAYVSTESNASSLRSAKFDNILLMNALGFWLQCPAMQALIRVILTSACINKTEAKTLIDRLLKYSPHSDWVLAHLCTNISESLNLTDYIEQLINDAASYSITFILSYVSEHNPQAIVNCSKSNLPLLLRLCTNSKPLLDLLAHDAVKKVDVKSLNKLVESHTSGEINDYIIYCVLNAPNAFEFLKISFDLVVHPETSEALCTRILNILSLVTKQIHSYVYDSNNAFSNTYPIISLLRNNIQQLISHPSIAKNTALKKLQLRLLNLICICFGSEFITEVFHHLMNVATFTISASNYETVKLNPLLLPLFNSLRLHFGINLQNCVKNTLKLHYSKKLVFWAFLSKFVESNPVPLEVDDLIVYLNQKSFDRCGNIFKKYYILKVISKMFDSNQKLFTRQQYRLCICLVNTFFELMQEMQANYSQHLVVIINSIVICQKLLSSLANNFLINENIICRYFLDFIQEKNELFQSEYSVCNSLDSNGNYEYRSILNENLFKFGHIHKSKKNRLLPHNKANQKRETVTNKCLSLNRQILIDLLQSCVKDKMSFAMNFVSSLSNELLLHDAPWLDEDPKDGQIQHMRMTFEKDLYVSSQFEHNPILWNIFELISKGQYLKHCLVIIRALVNVQRANLNSSTFRDQNILLTQRIVTLIANNEILPQKPFIYIPDLVPKVKNWEMSYVLHDITKYIRDNNTANNSSSTKLALKPYLDRLRLMMAHHHPDEVYVKIFKCI